MAYHLITQIRGLLHSFLTPFSFFFFLFSFYLLFSSHLLLLPCVVAELDFVFANTFYGLFLPTYQMGGVCNIWDSVGATHYKYLHVLCEKLILIPLVENLSGLS